MTNTPELHNDDDETAPIVVCARCKREHKGFTHDQADGCAADITKLGVYGHYGSAEADMTELRFTPDHPDVPQGLEGGQMCDICIVELKKKGALTKHSERPAFGQDVNYATGLNVEELFDDEPATEPK